MSMNPNFQGGTETAQLSRVYDPIEQTYQKPKIMNENEKHV